MRHVMLDLETLGTNPNAPIASIGAVFFDPLTGVLGQPFSCRVDFENDMKNGAVPDGDTIKWWLRQSSEARAELIQDNACPILWALTKFSDFLTDNAENLGTLQVWANSPSFDCVILRSAFDRTNTSVPWKYWNERDVRTIKAMRQYVTYFDWTVEAPSVKHKALDDAIAQARMVSAAMSRLAQHQGGGS